MSDDDRPLLFVVTVNTDSFTADVFVIARTFAEAHVEALRTVGFDGLAKVSLHARIIDTGHMQRLLSQLAKRRGDTED